MREAIAGFATLKEAVSHWLKVVGLGIEWAAAAVIVAGLAWSTTMAMAADQGSSVLK